nr:reverse transcriptase domain-containing protein [Tanacetum cinerariifolium]
MRPKECYDLIKNMTTYNNDWDTSAQRSESSYSITSSFDTEIAALKAKMAKINKNLIIVLQVNQQVKAVTSNCKTCGGPHSFSDCPTTIGQTLNIPQRQVVTTNAFTNFMKENNAILKNMQTNMTSLNNLNLELKNKFGQFMKMNTASSSGSRTLPGNTITNPKEDLKGITTQNGTAYQGPTIPTTSSSSPLVERETEVTKDTVHPTNNRSTEDVQPPVVPTESTILNSEPVNSPIIKPVASPVSAPRPNQRPSIPYPSRLHDQKLRNKANDQREKFFQIFKDLNFNISFSNALILMPKFGPSIKSLLTNKDKLSLADLDPSINLMPLSVWNKLYLPDLSHTCMTLELADRSISSPVGVTEDVFVKVGTFHFPADFVVVDFDADPRVPLILERSFLKTRKALIDVFEGELALHVGKEAITFNLDQTSRYSANYNDLTANRIDVIDMACEEYSQEVIAFIALEDDPTSSKVDQFVDTEGDILLLEAFLNDDPSLPPPNQGNYLPEAYKRAIAWKLSDIKDVIKNEVLKILDAGLIYPISDSLWRVRIDYHKLNEATPKDHFPLPFMDQMLERLAGNQYYCFLDGFSGYFQIPIDPKDQEKTTLTCPYGTFAYRRMPFGLCNAPGTFQRCMMAIFYDMIEKTMEVFMDDFLVFRNSFKACLSYLKKMLKWFEDTNLCLNWQKCHFMVKEDIVLDHKISKEGIEVDKAKVEVITNLPHPITVKRIRSFLVIVNGDSPPPKRTVNDVEQIYPPTTIEEKLARKNELKAR